VRASSKKKKWAHQMIIDTTNNTPSSITLINSHILIIAL
jgi:hypothetical protein